MFSRLRRLFGSTAQSEADKRHGPVASEGVSLDGESWKVAKTHDDVGAALDNSQRVLYAINNAQYVPAGRQLIAYLKLRYGEESAYSNCVVPAEVLCAKCLKPYSQRWKNAMASLSSNGQPGPTCPSCNSSKDIYLRLSVQFESHEEPALVSAPVDDSGGAVGSPADAHTSSLQSEPGGNPGAAASESPKYIRADCATCGCTIIISPDSPPPHNCEGCEQASDGDEPTDYQKMVASAIGLLGTGQQYDMATLGDECESLRRVFPQIFHGEVNPVVNSPISIGPNLDKLVAELVKIGEGPGFLQNTLPSPFTEYERFHPRCRAIGILLNDVGKFPLMQVVGAVHRYHSPMRARELEVAWQRIGKWQA